jgi:hypothetical protein
MAFSGVDKFPLVAKILVDMRLQELVEENRKLKEYNDMLELRVFWRTYGIVQLRARITNAIGYSLVDHCNCCSCSWAGKSRQCNGEDECNLKICFERLARKHGFTVVGEDGEKFAPIENEDLEEDEEFNEDLQFFCSGDVHFVMASSVTDWVVLGYGEKLNQAKSIHDPELVKLKKFFEKLGNRWP